MPYPGMLVPTKPEVQTTPGNHDGDHERFAHIVKRTKEFGAKALITQAMVEGRPIVALCGKRWIPSRDPKNFPLCPECEKIAVQMAKDRL